MTEYGLQATPFSPPELHPLVAHLGNVVYTRRSPWPLALGDVEGTLRPVLRLPPFTTGCALVLRCGETLWQIRLGSDALPRLHPALADVPKDAPLPLELRQGLIEVLATPLIDVARQLFGVPVSIQDILLDAAAASSAPQGDAAALCLPLEWRPAPVQNQPETPHHKPVPIWVDLPDRASVLLLLERLKTLPRRNALDEGTGAMGYNGTAILGAVPIPLSVEAGNMRLTMRELADLAQDDILLPDDYPAARGLLTLRVLPCALSPLARGTAEITAALNPGGYPLNAPTIACSVDGSRVTVTGFVPPLHFQETAMTAADLNDAQTAAQPPAQSDAEGNTRHDLGDIEVLLHFELERRIMTVQDIATLAPGYTFALGCDVQAPVTLRVNGKPLGAGRLVDLNGVIGVQITRLDTV